MLKKLTDRIYYMPHNHRTDRPVIGLVSGDKYSLIVDGGNSPAHANEFLQCVSKFDIAPIKYLVITHWHWDHVFGLETMNVTTICHYKTKEKLTSMQKLAWDDFSLDKRVERGEEIEFCRDMMKLEMPCRDDLKIGNVDITFKEYLEIDLGGIGCIVENVGGSHSDDSTIVHIPKEKTMFLGDCLCEDIYNGNWSYSKNKLLPMIDKIKGYETEYYLTSHDDPESKDQIWRFIDKLVCTGELVGDDKSIDKVIDRYIELYRKKPSKDEIYYINSFVNGNKKT